ncbi:biotin transporter BioY [Clostridium aestuarii]|nr:biotin transporter BioY [Clostridium aestuarii]
MKTKELTLVSLFAALMVVGAYVSIPTPWVPLTFQPFFCCFAGVLLGSRLGALSQIVYILIGLCGVPVFQGGKAGPSVIVSTTFGYLIGFVISAYVIGQITETRKASIKNLSLGVLIGLAIIYIFGVAYLYVIVNFYIAKPMSIIKAIQAGFIPFIIKDLVLSGIVVTASYKIIPALNKAGLRIIKN